MVHRSSATGRTRAACYGVSVSVHALVLASVGGLLTPPAGPGGSTVVTAIQFASKDWAEPSPEPPEEFLWELDEGLLEEEAVVRETLAEWSELLEPTRFFQSEESEHGLLRKTHWREVTKKVKPVRELAVLESPSSTERISAEPCTDRPGAADAVLLEAPPPVYPAGSLRAREEGTVTLAVVIGSDGRTISAHVSVSSGFRRLDKAALEAVRCWRFRPARIGGVPIRSTLLHRFTFQLQSP